MKRSTIIILYLAVLAAGAAVFLFSRGAGSLGFGGADRGKEIILTDEARERLYSDKDEKKENQKEHKKDLGILK